jgi:hypothetical protein
MDRIVFWPILRSIRADEAAREREFGWNGATESRITAAISVARAVLSVG